MRCEMCQRWIMTQGPTIRRGEITIEDRRREPLYRITVCGDCAEEILEYIYKRAKEDAEDGEHYQPDGSVLDRDA